MNVFTCDIDFSRPLQGGAYAVDEGDLPALARRAARDGLQVRQIPLTGCHGKGELLSRLVQALPLPADFGDNWDALADVLRDPTWAPGRGHALLFAHADDLRRANARDFDRLLGILDAAAAFAIEQNRPFFALLELPANAFARRR